MARIKYFPQTGRDDCGIACLACLLSSFKSDITLASVKRTANFGGNGFSLKELETIGKSIVQNIGLHSIILSDIKKYLPCLVPWKPAHYVVLISAKREGITLFDPASGFSILDLDQLNSNVAISEVAGHARLQIICAAGFKRPLMIRLTTPAISEFFWDFLKQRTKTVFIYYLWTLVNWICATSLSLILIKSLLSTSYPLYPYLSGTGALAAVALLIATLVQSRKQAVNAAREFCALLETRLIEGFSKISMSLSTSYRNSACYTTLIDLGVLESSLGVNIPILISNSVITLSVLNFYFYVHPFLFFMNVSWIAFSITKVTRHRHIRNSENFRETPSGDSYENIVRVTASEGEDVRLHCPPSRTISALIAAQKKMNAVFISQWKARTLHRVLRIEGERVRNAATYVVGLYIVSTSQTNILALCAIVILDLWFGDLIISSRISLEALGRAKFPSQRFKERLLELESCRGLDLFKSTSSSVTLKSRNLNIDCGSRRVLSGIHLEITSGCRHVILGPSGSGKTTLCRVMLGLHPCEQNTLLANDQPLGQVVEGQFRRHCVGVFTESQWLGARIEYDITQGHDLDPVFFASLCEVVGLKKYTNETGADAILRKMDSTVSNAERQRWSLLRALYRCPSILFIDDATNALTVEEEREVLGNISQHMSERSLVLFSSRSVVANAFDCTIHSLQRGQLLNDPATPSLDLRSGLAENVT